MQPQSKSGINLTKMNIINVTSDAIIMNNNLDISLEQEHEYSLVGKYQSKR